MGGEVGDAPDGVALDLDVGREHLADEGFESSELDDRELVLGCGADATRERTVTRRRERIGPRSAFVRPSRHPALFDPTTASRERAAPLTAKLPRAALAALWTSTSWLLRRNKMGSSVSRETSWTSFSVISAKARAALRWRSTLSLYERVESARSGSPAKKLVAERSGWRRAA